MLKTYYIAFVTSTSDVVGLLRVGVASAGVELPHLLKQVGPNSHQFDAVRSG